MNLDALVAIFAFAGAVIGIFGWLYAGASRSFAHGELGAGGVRLLRWALVGYVVIFVLLATTALLA